MKLRHTICHPIEEAGGVRVAGRPGCGRSIPVLWASVRANIRGGCNSASAHDIGSPGVHKSRWLMIASPTAFPPMNEWTAPPGGSF